MAPPPFRRRRRPKGPDLSRLGPEELAAHQRRAQLDTPIAQLELSVRIANVLDRHGVFTVRDLVKMSWAQLAAVPSLGVSSLAAVRAALVKVGVDPLGWKPTRAPGRDLIDLS